MLTKTLLRAKFAWIWSTCIEFWFNALWDIFGRRKIKFLSWIDTKFSLGRRLYEKLTQIGVKIRAPICWPCPCRSPRPSPLSTLAPLTAVLTVACDPRRSPHCHPHACAFHALVLTAAHAVACALDCVANRHPRHLPWPFLTAVDSVSSSYGTSLLAGIMPNDEEWSREVRSHQPIFLRSREVRA